MVFTRSPLRILFSGSDHFSATSMKALHQEHLQDRRSIASIDVVIIKSKGAGQGLKKLKGGPDYAVPIRFVAKELKVPVYEILALPTGRYSPSTTLLPTSTPPH
ncbi:hypothetical protein BDZ91DRAFT_758975 [Kalaharituber pfeilii]|nr:hypothetical protein BDZ91DRAFT_758975 [Kalaharituber pfeilii]